MNYFILGIAIIFIVLIMDTKKKEAFREGADYTKAGNNYCVNDAQKDLLQTVQIRQNAWPNRKACMQECDSQGEKCSAIEWYDSGWNGSSCHLMLDDSAGGQGAATTHKEGTRWQDAECHIKSKAAAGDSKYEKQPKNTNCPTGSDITTQGECQTAIRALALKYDPWWTGNHGDIPRGCTWTDAVLDNKSRGSLSHWNAWTNSAGKPRYDLHPICKKAGDGGWVKCADEGGKCQCSGRVRYGKNQTWGKILDAQGEIHCNNGQQWGDPLFGVKKECQCNSDESGETGDYSFLFDGCPRGGAASSWKMVQNETNFEKCKEICSNDPKCNAFEINECGTNKGDSPSNCNKRCYNFYGDGSDFRNGGCVTDGNQKAYKKLAGLEKGPCKEDDDYDHGGADITSFQNIPSSSACCDKCKANLDCKSWTWGKVGGNWSKTCWIKNKQFGGGGKRTKKAGLISGQPPVREAVGMLAPESGRVTNPSCVRYNWNDWSPCNRMCAGGTQTRIRSNNGFCIESGKVVYFDSEKRACNTQECPRGPTGQLGELGLRGPKGPVGRKGPVGKSGGGTGFPGSSGIVGGVGIKGNLGITGPKGETGFRGEEGKVMSKAQVNNDLLSGIYEQLIKFGGVDKEDGDDTAIEEFCNLKPFNNSNYN